MFSKPLAVPFDPGSRVRGWAAAVRPSFVGELWSPMLVPLVELQGEIAAERQRGPATPSAENLSLSGGASIRPRSSSSEHHLLFAGPSSPPKRRRRPVWVALDGAVMPLGI